MENKQCYRIISSDIDSLGINLFNKLKLFFNIEKHELYSLQHTPLSVQMDYLKKCKKNKINRDDILKGIEFNLIKDRYIGSGCTSNIYSYLSIYINLEPIPEIYNYGKDVKVIYDAIFNNRTNKLKLLNYLIDNKC